MTLPEHADIVIAALNQAPGFESVGTGDCTIRRLGGMTNLVHQVDSRLGKVIVRIPGEGTEAYIDRAVEIVNARAAERAGVSAEVIWADPASGVMISRAIENIVTMTPALFATRDGAAGRAGQALARLHGSGESFDFRFELFTMIDDYLKLLSTKDVSLPGGYHDAVAAAEPVKAALQARPTPLRPCHCDPLCENFLDDGKRMWIVDWEYSGMNDPLWDVGDLAVEAALNDAQQAELLFGYYGREPELAEIGRTVIYKAMCDLLWTLWGLIQHADGNSAEDFWAYSVERFERCKAVLNSAEFPAHLAAVAKA